MNQKKKGNKAERDASKLFKQWAGSKYDFGRVPMSGGLRWKRTSDTSGDITSTTDGHILQFCVEVKHHADIDFSQLIRPGLKGVKIYEFWEQCTDDARRSFKIPMLLCRYNGMAKGQFFVIMNNMDIKALGMLETEEDTYIKVYNTPLVIFMSSTLLHHNYRELHFKAKIINKAKKKSNGKKIKIKR